eukprot:8987818-Prorocentrum_lima.AAC.1
MAEMADDGRASPAQGETAKLLRGQQFGAIIDLRLQASVRSLCARVCECVCVCVCACARV